MQEVDSNNSLDTKSFESVSLNKYSKNVQLINEKEIFLINNIEDFTEVLDLTNANEIKIISAFGTSGDGKSYFLNSFSDRPENELFKTSSTSEQGTLGVWGVYHINKSILYLDTQPIQSQSNILLLKIFAISDIVVYRTRSERLSESLYRFLGEASEALVKYFKDDLKKVDEDVRSPTVFICHETLFSSPLKNDENQADRQILNRIKELNYNTDGIDKLVCVSMKLHTSTDPTNSFEKIKIKIEKSLNETTKGRTAKQIFDSLKILSDKFKGRLVCSEVCQACNAECELAVGHEAVSHSTTKECRHVKHYKNIEKFCKKCDGKVTMETLENWWYFYEASYKLNCTNCNEIYRTDSEINEDSVALSRFVHVWPNEQFNFNGSASTNMRRIFEYAKGTCKSIAEYAQEYVKPSYWQPDSEIKNCIACKRVIDKSLGLHHCRDCGKGVCEACSKERRIVRYRGWHSPVRICDLCKPLLHGENQSEIHESVMPRQATELAVNGVKPLKYVLGYTKSISEVLTDFIRPAYWVPDEDMLGCGCCQLIFDTTPKNSRHHCRCCGKSVCDACSPHREPVKWRDWHVPVRVCKNCINEVKAKNQPEKISPDKK